LIFLEKSKKKPPEPNNTLFQRPFMALLPPPKDKIGFIPTFPDLFIKDLQMTPETR
jgi:hypothetical protein